LGEPLGGADRGVLLGFGQRRHGASFRFDLSETNRFSVVGNGAAAGAAAAAVWRLAGAALRPLFHGLTYNSEFSVRFQSKR